MDEVEESMPITGICRFCGEQLGTLRINPYIEELYGEIVVTYICDDCYCELCADI